MAGMKRAGDRSDLRLPSLYLVMTVRCSAMKKRCQRPHVRARETRRRDRLRTKVERFQVTVLGILNVEGKWTEPSPAPTPCDVPHGISQTSRASRHPRVCCSGVGGGPLEKEVKTSSGWRYRTRGGR